MAERVELVMDAAAASAASPPPARQPAERAELLPACKNCGRFSAAPYLHSFSAALDQTKNQTYQNSNGWIVTPTSCDATTAGVAGAAFCSGDCLYSYLFAHDFMTNKTADVALHFFKKVDAFRPSGEKASTPSRSRLDRLSSDLSGRGGLDFG